MNDVGQPARDALRRLRIELRIVNDAVAAEAGLNPRDLDVLDVIDREGPCTPSWLAERTGLRRATLTTMLARLQRDGWISREADPADGRSAFVSSTPRFEELRDLYAPIDATAAEVFGRRSEQERQLITVTLDDLADQLREGSAAEQDSP